MPEPTVSITLEYDSEIVDSRFGIEFITALCEESLLVPQQIDTSEAYKEPFLGIEDFANNWWAQEATAQFGNEAKFTTYWGPYWRRRSKVVSSGRIEHGLETSSGRRTPTSCSFEAKWSDKVDFLRLFSRWAQISSISNARLHLLTDAEEQAFERILDDEALDELYAFQFGLFGGAMRPGIPNISWAMAYGKKDFDLIDFEGIQSAGFPLEVSDELAIVRVTEDISDIAEDLVSFCARRAELKQFFPDDMFNIILEPSLV